jgi:hypothetical protein
LLTKSTMDKWSPGHVWSLVKIVVNSKHGQNKPKQSNCWFKINTFLAFRGFDDHQGIVRPVANTKTGHTWGRSDGFVASKIDKLRREVDGALWRPRRPPSKSANDGRKRLKDRLVWAFFEPFRFKTSNLFNPIFLPWGFSDEVAFYLSY